MYWEKMDIGTNPSPVGGGWFGVAFSALLQTGGIAPHVTVSRETPGGETVRHSSERSEHF